MASLPERESAPAAQPGGVDPAVAAAWNGLVASAPSIHVEQHVAWGEVRRLDGWTPDLVLVRHGDVPAAGALVLTRRIGRWLRIGYVSRGPLLAVNEGDGRLQTSSRILAELKHYAKRRRLAVLVVNPPYYPGVPPRELVQAGFTPHLHRLPPTGLMRGAVVVDLRVTEDQLWAGLRPKYRQIIRKAERSGLRVRAGGEADIPVLWELMVQLCRRRKCEPNVSSADVIRALWTRFAPAREARLDVVERDGVAVTAMLTFCLGSWASPWRIGWSGAEPGLSPERLLYWSAMRSALHEGKKVFDLNWADPDEAAAVRAGAEIPSQSSGGITQSKMGYGGKIVPLDAPMDYFPNPAMRVLVRFGGTRLLNSKMTGRILARLNAR